MSHPSIAGQASVFNRRDLIQGAAAGSLAAGFGLAKIQTTYGQTPESAVLLDEMVIDLSAVPESIDPALAYSPRDWSIVHSIYDSPVGFTEDGTIQPLAAETFETVDDVTYEIVLRAGLTFHDGTPVTSAAITRSVAYMQESESQAASLFAGITQVEEVDELTARIVSDLPSPWLPAQLAVWLLLIPEGFTADEALASPLGSGPYRFDSQEQGNSITLTRNPDYTWGSPKGIPMAERLTYRFVPESSTRIADLSTGASQLIAEIPTDQLPAVSDGGALPVEVGVVASHWIRIATDAAPFDSPAVRQALNFAIDVEGISQALVSSESHRLASLFPDARSLAFNPDLAPYTYDPEKAQSLLAEAGFGDGFETSMEITNAARVDVAEAIAAQLGEVGISVTIKVSEYTEFNSGWKNPEAPALRMVTWGPLYDPHTLLSLVFASEGFLSRYANPDVDDLINGAAIETDPAARAELYQELSAVMFEDAPAVYLWNLTSGYGVAENAEAWQPRGDEYVIATVTGE
jgi:peptide/nickel transport system substrate-binding protein